MSSRWGGVTRVLGSRSMRRVGSAVSLTVVASTLVVLAVRSDGTPVADVTLNDGSVWVTSLADAGMARLNPAVLSLDAFVNSTAEDFDVTQEASNVFLDTAGRDSAGLAQVDVARAVAGQPVELPRGTRTVMGGDTVAVIDRGSGHTWVRPAATVGTLSVRATEPDANLGKGALVAVSDRGTVFGWSPAKSQVRSLSFTPTGELAPGEALPLKGVKGDEVQLSTAGETPVAFDAATGVISWPDHDPVTLKGAAGGVLQARGSQSAAAYVATTVGLIEVDLRDGSVSAVPGLRVNGTPAAPVVVGSCVHAAWADPASDQASFEQCDGAAPKTGDLDELTTTADLVFRVNRQVVVLNDVITGDSWLVQNDSMDLVDNWDSINPDKQKDEQDSQTTTEVQRTEENHPPQAHDDDLGARPGLATILPVTANDTDPDGDILVITKWESDNPDVQIAKAGKDTQLQVTFPDSAVGSYPIHYWISDGRAADDVEAVATVHLTPDGANAPPRLLPGREMTMSVASGAENSTYVLPDWQDPDGDDLTVIAATPAEDTGTVRFRPDGVIGYLDDGAGAGIETVNVTVTDGRGATVQAPLKVNVSNARRLPPELVADRAVATAGSPTIVDPLANDTSPDGTPLSLVSVVPQPGVEIAVDPIDGSLTVRADNPKTYYLDYKAANDGGQATSFIRLDVLPDSGKNSPPVAVRDHALLPPGGSTLVDLLANDGDPDDDVLVVQSVRVPPRTGLKASLINKRLLRIAPGPRDLDEPVTVGYTISDGHAIAEGSIVVTQAQATDRNLPPTAVDDAVTVRAGAVNRVAVLANDADPEGDSLTLLQSDLENPNDFPIYVAGRQIRLRAPKEPGQYQATYTVHDSRDKTDSATIRITVLPDSKVDNRPPRPQPIVARTFSDRRLRVNIPLVGSDPDGDSVSFVGVTKAPRFGRIMQQGLDWFEYEPFNPPDGGLTGTDTFQLTVQDKYGATGVADVRIGVVNRAGINQPPVALDDVLRVRPGRTVQYNVRGNDVDPDGDTLTLDPELTMTDGTEAKVDEDSVVVRVPQSRQVTRGTIGYTVSDGFGGADAATLLVIGDPDAPLYAPVTRDDVATLDQISGKKVGDTVNIPVLDNDVDIDGSRSDLKVAAVDPDTKVVKGNKLRVVLKREDRVVAYQVSDRDKQSSYGFVFISGTNTVPPQINPASIPVRAKAGERIELPLDKYVLVRSGHQPLLTTASKVSAPVNDGGKLFKDRQTLLFGAPKDYYGKASISFEVTDGATANDPDGLRSLLTIPIDVQGVQNFPPSARSTQVEVPLEGDAVRVDLGHLASDPNKQDVLGFSVDRDKLVESSLADDGVLTLSPAGSAEDGDTAVLTYTVTDPKGLSAKGTVQVRFVGKDVPLLQVRQLQAEGSAGTPVTVDVAPAVIHQPDQPVVVQSATVESGSASGVKISGTRLTTTPTKDFAGSVVVKYVVTDDPQDASRRVTGRVLVAVIARPDAPAQPDVSGVASRTATLSWREPEDNGAPVTGYVITGARGLRKELGRRTTYTFTNLENGKPYAFKVAAVNKVGTSEASPESEAVTPNEVPRPMGTPVVEATKVNGELHVTWQAGRTDGTAIKEYQLELIGTGQTKSVGANTLDLVWGGLPNGANYQFRVRATNDQGEGEFSQPSTPAHAFGPPLATPGVVASTPNDAELGGQKVRVDWQAADGNGDPVTGYQVFLFKNGAEAGSSAVLSAAARDYTFDASNGDNYTAQVQALNAAGPGERSAQSNQVNPYGPAGAVTGVTKTKDGDHYSTIKFTPPGDTGGRPIAYYQVTSTGGPDRQFTGPSGDVPFDANSGPYTATITPFTKKDGGGFLAGASTSIGGLRPWGTPGDANGNAAGGYKSVNFSQSPGPSNGRPVLGVEYNPGNGWVNGGSYGTGTNQGGDQACIWIRTVAEGENPGERAYSNQRQVCGTADPRHVNVTMQPISGAHGNCTSTCAYIQIQVDGFQNGVKPTPTITQGNQNWTGVERGIQIGNDGRGQDVNYYYTGFAGTVVVNLAGVVGTACWRSC